MDEFTKARIEQQVDDQSAKLIAEFRQHVLECQLHNPAMTDSTLIFQGWAIQKIAGLQNLALNLTERVIELEQRKKRQ